MFRSSVIRIMGCPARDGPRKKEDMLARNNYSYQKRLKELAKQKKQEENRQRKLARKNIQAKDSEAQVSNGDSEESSDENAALK